ncbi:hypothetical protein ABZX90_35865 [Streptomyces sp. NPDC002935]|uniref:hypothetical protein n=1 Tax=unclassified Streptomyces TaxID=2593676 RepID=UPI0033338F20
MAATHRDTNPLVVHGLAASEHFTPDYPFSGLAVMRQSLEQPGLSDIGVGFSPHCLQLTGRSSRNLCTTLGWPCA